MPIRNILPRRLRAPLWGDRPRWGLTPNLDDPCWQKWQTAYTDFYQANQREGIGQRVNDAGYAVMSSITLTGKRVLEIGAGDIRHIKYWQGAPAEYILADISPEMMAFAQKRLEERGIAYRSMPVVRNQSLALPDASVDVIVSFYSLEHLYPLRPYLDEFKRLLKPGGCLIGAIPTEGGLAWGGAPAYLPALVQEKHQHRPRQDYMLGASQLCRSHSGGARSGIHPPSRRILAANLAAAARPQFGHSLVLSQVSGVMCGR
jgi:ubiquinone/menaquinone biosynthesis C-methylase UbiE